MNKLVLHYCRLRRAPLLVRIIVAAAAPVVAALVKEDLRAVWAHFHLSPSMMDFVVTMLEFPIVAFFASPAVRGLACTERVPDALLAKVDADLAAITKDRVEAPKKCNRHLFVPVGIAWYHMFLAPVAGAGGEFLDNLLLVFKHRGFLNSPERSCCHGQLTRQVHVALYRSFSQGVDLPQLGPGYQRDLASLNHIDNLW